MKRYIAFVLILMIFTTIIGICTSEKMLNGKAEETLSREDIEGGAMPCMLIDEMSMPDVKGAKVEQTASEEILLEERQESGEEIPFNESLCPLSDTEAQTSEEASSDPGTPDDTEEVMNEQETSEEELDEEILLQGRKTELATERQHENDMLSGEDKYPTEIRNPDPMDAPLYTVNGSRLPDELSNYAYSVCQQFGIEWYYPHLLCQMYQESRFQQSAVSPSGDYGLMQLKGIYHAYFKQIAGIPWADLVNDPYANIYCGIYLMQMYLHQCGDLNTAISAYNTGSVNSYNPAYVNQVRQWEGTLQRIR